MSKTLLLNIFRRFNSVKSAIAAPWTVFILPVFIQIRWNFWPKKY